jgi:hypothetical protein
LFGNVLANSLLLGQLVENPLLILLVVEINLGLRGILRRDIDIQLQNLDILFGLGELGFDLLDLVLVRAPIELNSGWPFLTGAPSSTRTSVTSVGSGNRGIG